MKRLKKFFPALTVLVVALASFAFTSKTVDNWLACDPEYAFVYNGAGSKFLPSSYTYAPNYTSTCVGVGKLCAIVVCEGYVEAVGEEDFALTEDAIASSGEIGSRIPAAEASGNHTYFDPNHTPPRWVIILKQ